MAWVVSIIPKLLDWGVYRVVANHVIRFDSTSFVSLRGLNSTSDGDHIVALHPELALLVDARLQTDTRRSVAALAESSAKCPSTTRAAARRSEAPSLAVGRAAPPLDLSVNHSVDQDT
jgi:hypothetical protein